MNQLMSVAGFDRRDLRMLWSLFKLTLTDRYLGSRLGLIWAVLSPLLLMGMFTFVFTFVFPGRIPGRDNPLASTTFCFITSAYGVPITYMLYVDAFGYARRGISGSLAIDAVTGIVASVLLGAMLVWLRRRNVGHEKAAA